MSRRDCQLPLRHRLAAVVLLVHLLAVVALAASPRLHHWAHPDADDDDHDCAVVLFLHGGGDAPPAPVIVPVFVGTVTFVSPALAQVGGFVPSVFAGSRVFEHAPPAAS